MSEAKKATCSICGKKYDLCLSCRKELSVRPWKEVADTENCYKIYMCLLQFNNGYLSKEDAKKQLERINYNHEELLDNVKENIKTIILNPNPSKKVVEKKTTNMNSN